MTVFQFLVILTVKVNSTAAFPHTHPLYSVYEGGWQGPDGRGHCMHVQVNAVYCLSVCHVNHDFRGLRIPGSGSSAAPLHGAHRF